jgi:hypothetical protein
LDRIFHDPTDGNKSAPSQLYNYFSDKHGLVEAVVAYQSAAVRFPGPGLGVRGPPNRRPPSCSAAEGAMQY